jgi:NADPH:quinone reductase-like Zn-dependent oxidoreductase
MKAIVYHNFGSPDVLSYEETEKPVPNENEVLVKVRAASVNPADFHIMRGKPLLFRPMMGGLRKPKITRMGGDLAGQVEAVGSAVTLFKPGDVVFGCCRGAFAEYVCGIEDRLALKPANISFEEAAAVPIAALTALQGLRDYGRIQPGQKILVDGASGGVGTFAIQIAKSFGVEVTAVCNTGKMDTARLLGADQVIDYTKENFTRSGQRYDLIFAANAYHSIFDYRRSLSQRGICVFAGGDLGLMFRVMFLGPLLSRIGEKKLYFFIAKINRKDLDILRGLLETRKVVPVIDRRYPLSEVADATRYLEDGHAKGKVVITVQHGDAI